VHEDFLQRRPDPFTDNVELVEAEIKFLRNELKAMRKQFAWQQQMEFERTAVRLSVNALLSTFLKRAPSKPWIDGATRLFKADLRRLTREYAIAVGVTLEPMELESEHFEDVEAPMRQWRYAVESLMKGASAERESAVRRVHSAAGGF
jgi:hypothetical protein